MSWVLVFTMVGGWGSASGVQFFWLPAEAQCEAALAAIEPLQGALAAVCIGPDRQVHGWD
jgi:hypothetical protein